MLIKIFKNKENKLFFTYLSFLFICSSIFLFNKHTVGNDSTISEWLINYQGGFTRRGLLGEFAFKLALLFEAKIRFVIFLFQLFFYLIFLILIYNFIKNININFLSRLALYTPIFLLFPLAEIESLVRKETIIFIIFIIFLYLASNKYNEKYCNNFILLIFPISFFIWEPVIFFFAFILFILYLKNFEKNIKKTILKVFFVSLPSLIIFFLVILNPLSAAGGEEMCEKLQTVFGERCYMSLGLLTSKSTIAQQFLTPKLEYVVRYILIIIAGFFPLFILCANSRFYKKNINLIFNFKSFFSIIIILLCPTLVLFAAMYDWGRVVNISYTFSILTFLFLIKNKYLQIYEGKFYLSIRNFLSYKKYYYIIFFFYCFCWYVKTVISDKIGTIPIYQIIRKTLKIIINFYF